MNIAQPIIEALESLSANKLRSSLTILGIVIGVAAVIAMLAIGRGAQSSITGTIEGIGTNLIFVSPNRSSDVHNPKPLTMKDAQAIADFQQAPSVANVAPVVQGSAELTFGRETSSTSITGVTPEYLTVRNEAITDGEFINDEQNKGRSSVVVLGPATADNLFGRHDSSVIGERININGQPFRVIGILKSKGGSSFGNQDDVALVPLATAQARLIRRSPADRVDMLQVQAAGPDAVAQATDEISAILRSRHRTGVGVDDFQIFTQESILSTVQTVTGVLTVFLGGIAAISLLVGGIGIMNIMLVSVTERTREIGLRKALGARRMDILVQFLAESLVLSLLGGIIGIALGWGISTVVGRIAAASNAAINPTIGLDTILLATLFSSFVGLFFGIYPANRAAGLEPVEALRYE